MMGMQCLVELRGPKVTLNFNPGPVCAGLVTEGTAADKRIYNDAENF